ncbi:MAG: helix-turn-helix transcriptional regulator [Duganella sp.]
MKTLTEVGASLQQARAERGVTQQALALQTGLTPVTMRGVFTGKTDARISTIMALADQLGLELLLVPKVISAAIDPPKSPAPSVQSRVSRIIHGPR